MKTIIATIVTVLVISLIVAGAVIYIVRSKKSGEKCIGCPDSKNCPGAKCGTCGGCAGNR